MSGRTGSVGSERWSFNPCCALLLRLVERSREAILERDSADTKGDIALISKYELKLMHDHLKRVCKFDDVVMRFVPVGTKQYMTRKTPKTRGGCGSVAYERQKQDVF